MKRNPLSGSPLYLFLGLLIYSLNAGHGVAQDFIEVRSPRTLSVDKISCQRIPLGEVEDYKPTIVLMPDGELVLSMFTGRRLENGKIAEQAILYRSADGGLTWSKPRLMVNTAEVHVFLTELADGRILATYSDYHLPYGVSAIVSTDGGRSWDREHPARLVLSADLYVGWPVTIQLADRSLLTAYAITAYLEQPPQKTVTEVVRWKLP